MDDQRGPGSTSPPPWEEATGQPSGGSATPLGAPPPGGLPSGGQDDAASTLAALIARVAFLEAAAEETAARADAAYSRQPTTLNTAPRLAVPKFAVKDLEGGAPAAIVDAYAYRAEAYSDSLPDSTTSKQRIDLLVSGLDMTATAWYMGLKPKPRDVAEYIALFRTEYARSTAHFEAVDALMQLQQNGRGDLQNYITTFRTMLRLTKMEDNPISVAMFCRGLTQYLRGQVMALCNGDLPASLTVAYQAAEKADALSNAISSRRASAPRGDNTSDSKATRRSNSAWRPAQTTAAAVTPTPPNLNRSGGGAARGGASSGSQQRGAGGGTRVPPPGLSAEEQEMFTTGRCFGCGQHGHIRRDCPERKRQRFAQGQ